MSGVGGASRRACGLMQQSPAAVSAFVVAPIVGTIQEMGMTCSIAATQGGCGGWRLAALVAVAILAGGCASRQSPAPITVVTQPRPAGATAPAATGPAGVTTPSPTVSAQTAPVATVEAPPTAMSLGTESTWLRQWFDGTPVVITDESDGSVSVRVPMVHAFDAGTGVAVKPAIRAVIDKVSESLKRRQDARVIISAPEPEARADALRDVFRTDGIDVTRIATVPSADPTTVLMQMTTY